MRLRDHLVEVLERHVETVNTKIDEWRWGNLKPETHITEDILGSEAPRPAPTRTVGIPHSLADVTPLDSNYGSDLVQFHVFDLEPGSHLRSANHLFPANPTETKDDYFGTEMYTDFIISFPDALPPIKGYR